MTHPTKATLTQSDFDSWENCSVPDCENKVTHDSDRCYPHTYGWEAVRKNLNDRLEKATKAHAKNPTQQWATEISTVERELEKIKGRK